MDLRSLGAEEFIPLPLVVLAVQVTEANALEFFPHFPAASQPDVGEWVVQYEGSEPVVMADEVFKSMYATRDLLRLVVTVYAPRRMGEAMQVHVMPFGTQDEKQDVLFAVETAQQCLGMLLPPDGEKSSVAH